MPLPANPNFVQVRDFFGGSNSLRDYYRGGPYVPNNSANQAISATIDGLRLTQFSYADKIVLPPAPTLNNADASASMHTQQESASAWSQLEFRTTGFVYAVSVGEFDLSGNVYQWLPGGRSPGEYQVRTSSDGSTWSGWTSLGSNVPIVGASASTSYSESRDDYQVVYVQLGAQGTALTGVATFTAYAAASSQSR